MSVPKCDVNLDYDKSIIITSLKSVFYNYFRPRVCTLQAADPFLKAIFRRHHGQEREFGV